MTPPVTLRPITLSDNPAAFKLSELAFTADGQTTPAEAAARHERWTARGHAWFDWLHSRAQGHAWVATRTSDGAVIGYARALRDPAQRLEQLTELFVHPAFQRGQVGKALLAQVLPPQVPDGWRRIIVVHSALAPQALYLRWGVHPLGTAWYVGWRDGPSPSGMERGASLARAFCPPASVGARFIAPVSPSAPVVSMLAPAPTSRDAEIDWEQLLTLGDRIDRRAAMRLMGEQLGGVMLARERGGELMGYGARSQGEIGPVVGATPDDAVALVAAHLEAMLAAGETPHGLWVPGTNIALLRWLRDACPLRMFLRGQVAIMASDPSLVASLDRYVLTAPPYVW